ncbi:MAG: hypothetical protein RLN69_06140, partial [Woeseiaceae bacterium]
MITSRVIALAAGTMMIATAPSVFAGGDLWSYEGDSGPAHWGDISPAWGVCGNGRYQSPIDIKGGVEAKLGTINASIKPSVLKFGLDGPTFAVPYDSGSKLAMNGTTYELLQCHFHHTS